MRLEIKAGDLTVTYRGLGFRRSRLIGQVAGSMVDLAAELADDTSEPTKTTFGFGAGDHLASTEIAPVSRHDDGELRA